MQDVDEEFYGRADAHINLSNEQISKSIGKGKVSSSFMYSLSRFNAWVSASGWNTKKEMEESKEETIEYFVTEYRKMLEENFNDYIDNFNEYMSIAEEDNKKIECSKHGDSYTTYICSHLINQENKEWYSDLPNEESKWPDAWCSECNKHYESEGEWNEKSENACSGTINILCHSCYTELRASCNVHYLED